MSGILNAIIQWVLLVTLLWPTISQAQAPQKGLSVEEEVALSLFQSGLDAAQASKWNEALDLFNRSRHVIETPACVLNIALVEVRLGRFVAALRDLDRHEQLTTDSELKEPRERAAQIRTEVAPFVAWLTLSPMPPGGSVEVEGDARYVASASVLRVPLDPGKKELTIQAPGYASEVLTIEVTRGQELVAQLNLRPLSAPPPAAGNTPKGILPQATPGPATGLPRAQASTATPNRTRRVLIPFGASTGAVGAATGVLTFLIIYIRGSVGGPGLTRDEYDRLVVANTVGWSVFAVGGAVTLLGVLLPRTTAPSPTRPKLSGAGVTWRF